jgi:hypothetical protein
MTTMTNIPLDYVPLIRTATDKRRATVANGRSSHHGTMDGFSYHLKNHVSTDGIVLDLDMLTMLDQSQLDSQYVTAS